MGSRLFFGEPKPISLIVPARLGIKKFNVHSLEPCHFFLATDNPTTDFSHKHTHTMADSTGNQVQLHSKGAGPVARNDNGIGRGIRDKKLRSKLKSLQKKDTDQALKAKDSAILLEHDEGFLEPENSLEKTYKV